MTDKFIEALKNSPNILAEDGGYCIEQEHHELRMMLMAVIRHQTPNVIKNAEDLLERIDRD